MKKRKLFTNRYSLIAKTGFTLIELLVVLAIFIIITAVVLTRQNRFSSDILLTDLTYKIAISIRQAQVYGLAVRGSANAFNLGYGIHFDKTTPTNYKFFVDNNKDAKADAGEISSPSTVTYQIEKGDKIFKLCGINSSAATAHCSTDASNAITTLDIVYIRPNPSSLISSDKLPPSANPVSGSYDQAVITISSALGNRYKCVKVDRTGQVSVYNPVDGGSACFLE